MKEIVMKNKRLVIALSFFLICNLVVFNLFEPSIEMKVSTGGADVNLSFYYDNSLEGYPFDDTHMGPDTLLSGGGIQTISVPLSLEKLSKLRIDFGTIASSYKVHSFTILKSPIYEVNYDSKEFIRKFNNINDIDSYNIENNVVQIHTSGSDGHIYSMNLLNDMHATIRQDLIRKELIFIGLSLMLLIGNKILYLFKKVIIWFIKILIGSNRIICSRQKEKRVLGFLLVLLYSVLFALLIDVVLFRTIARVAQIFEWNTLYRYFSPALIFSTGRVYFIFIFLFIFGLILYFGIKKSIKYRYIFAAVFLLLMVGGRFTGSSLGFYDGMLQGNTENYKQSTLLGIPQGIRGDEWATEKPYYFAQVMGSDPLSYFNTNLSFDGNDMVVSAFAPVKDIVIIARPDLWGFLILSPEYAFSFYWWSRIVLLFMASFEMGLLLTKRYRYAAFTALIISFAPPVQWWLSQTLMLMLMSGQFALVLFNKYLNSTKSISKFLALLGVGFFALVYALTMYPATQVPLAYIFMAILVYLIIDNKSKKPFALKKLVHYVLAIVPFLGIIVHFYSKSNPAMTTIMNTIYPGSSRPWISLPWDYEFYQFVNVFTASVHWPQFLNASEISQFYTFAPFLIIVTLGLIWRNRNKLLLPSLLFGASVMLMLVAWLPRSSFINKITLLSFTYPVRITYAYGFGFTLLIICLLPLLERKIAGSYSNKNASLIAGTVGFLTLCILTNSENVFGFFKSFTAGTAIMIIIVALLSYMGYLLLIGGKKEIRKFAGLLTLLSIVSTCMVNPITQGLDSMFEKTTMKKIRELNNMDSGRWMVSGSPTISNLVSAQGVARTTGTYYYPDWKMMSVIDKEHKFIDMWNQFAHIDMRLTEGPLEFATFDHEKSEKVNGTNRIIYIPIETVRELGIKYIFTSVEVPDSLLRRGDISLLYRDKVDPWSIYKVSY
ncbi:hypothetical protein RQP50_26425 [Paenibacillus sp. chi10]|uniref:Uncharacterized protein n=1 Tax=Paenibacillus suaedae TaxID=3077233 RepID=A0AAJ2K398_9BACL|nr:hypothetical protein [Paenibacillus sp. chi10]MDT8979775.1 hypothetical protein [Paenibacillus sp. chi10]